MAIVMPMSSHDETDLLTVLYDGVLATPRWATFLSRLRRRTAADQAWLLVRPAGDPAGDVVTGYSAGGPAGDDAGLAALYRRAPALFHALRPGRVHVRSEFVDPRDPAHDLYRRAYLAAPALAHLRLMRVAEPDGAGAWLILGRAPADFTAAAGAVLSAVQPHLATALRLAGEMDRRQTGAFVAAAGLARLGLGWLTVDPRGRVVDHDGAGHGFVRHGLLQDRATGAAAERIAAILRRADPLSHVVRLSAEPRIDILIAPLPPAARSGGAVAAVYVDAANQAGGPADAARSSALRALFGLSPTEARLADAISRGEAIAAAAARIGITEQTARNYSKRIYAKTATTGQADLTRLVLTGLAGLA